MEQTLKKPRPHAELRKLWLDDDSIEIEYFEVNSLDNGIWLVVKKPMWSVHTQYRIKVNKVKKYFIAYQLTSSGEVYVSSNRYESVDKFMVYHQHLLFKWVDVISKSMLEVEE